MNDSDVYSEGIQDESIVLDSMFLEGDNLVYHDVAEEDDFIITTDPHYPDKEDAWVVIILKGEYQDWVVRFPTVTLDKGELEFTYEVVYLPDGAEFTDIEVANYMSSVITEVVRQLHQSEGQVYVDTKTGEQVVDY